MAITEDTPHDEIDEVLRPTVWYLITTLASAGRRPMQAVQDLRRVIEQASDEVERLIREKGDI